MLFQVLIMGFDVHLVFTARNRHQTNREAGMNVGTRYRLAPVQDDLRYAAKQCFGE